MSKEIQEAEIIKKLFQAFPTPAETKLSHEDCVTWRDQLWLLRHEDLIIYLGQVLSDLIKSRSGQPFATNGLDMVLQFLDIDVVEKDFSVLGKKAVGIFAEEAQYLKKSNLEMVKNFTKFQAQTIVNWLELARTWPDAKYHLDILDSALTYWQKRSNE